MGNSADKLPRSDAYSAEQLLLNKQQTCRGGACMQCNPEVSIGCLGSEVSVHFITDNSPRPIAFKQATTVRRLDTNVT